MCFVGFVSGGVVEEVVGRARRDGSFEWSYECGCASTVFGKTSAFHMTVGYFERSTGLFYGRGLQLWVRLVLIVAAQYQRWSDATDQAKTQISYGFGGV